jgi:hypothetical protein
MRNWQSILSVIPPCPIDGGHKEERVRIAGKRKAGERGKRGEARRTGNAVAKVLDVERALEPTREEAAEGSNQRRERSEDDRVKLERRPGEGGDMAEGLSKRGRRMRRGKRLDRTDTSGRRGEEERVKSQREATTEEACGSILRRSGGRP